MHEFKGNWLEKVGSSAKVQKLVEGRSWTVHHYLDPYLMAERVSHFQIRGLSACMNRDRVQEDYAKQSLSHQEFTPFELLLSELRIKWLSNLHAKGNLLGRLDCELNVIVTSSCGTDLRVT